MVKLKCKLGANTIREIEINPLDELNVLFKKLNITDEKSDFIYNGMNYSFSNKLTFKEIGLKSDNIIKITKKANAGGGPPNIKLQIKCKFGTNTIREVEVNVYDKINILLEKLNITDQTARFMYNSNIYSISNSMTFQEIGIPYYDDQLITFYRRRPID